jgi:glucose dehydrogenase
MVEFLRLFVWVISIGVFVASLYMAGQVFVFGRTGGESPVKTAEQINQTWQQANEVLTEKIQSGQSVTKVDLLGLIGTQSERTDFFDQLYNRMVLRFLS